MKNKEKYNEVKTKYDNLLTFININDKYNNQEEFYDTLQEYLPNKIELLNLMAV